jgi:hypothetical protein
MKALALALIVCGLAGGGYHLTTERLDDLRVENSRLISRLDLLQKEQSALKKEADVMKKAVREWAIQQATAQIITPPPTPPPAQVISPEFIASLPRPFPADSSSRNDVFANMERDRQARETDSRLLDLELEADKRRADEEKARSDAFFDSIIDRRFGGR